MTVELQDYRLLIQLMREQTQEINALKKRVKELEERPPVRILAGGGLNQAFADSRYLKLSGGTMTGNLDLASYSLQTTNYAVKEHAAYNALRIMNRAESTYQNLICNILYSLGWYAWGAACWIRTTAGATHYINFQSHDGGSYQTAIELIGGYANLPRAGNITMLTQKFFTAGLFTDANRGAAGTAGRIIFNTTDGNLNIDDGAQWILPDGTAT